MPLKQRRVPRGKDAEAYERFQRVAEVPMIILALAFIPIIVTPAVAELSDGMQATLDLAAGIIWGAFALEYVALLYLAPDRREMVRTHVLDLVIILLPLLRPLRLARAARALRAIAGLGRATVGLRTIVGRRGFQGFIGIAVVIISAGGLVAYAVEGDNSDATIRSAGDGLWWAITTATTVGYGDRYPVTTEGRVVATVLMMVGIALLSVVTANIAAYFVEHDAAPTEQSWTSELWEVGRLRDAGLLSESEFEIEKDRILRDRAIRSGE